MIEEILKEAFYCHVDPFRKDGGEELKDDIEEWVAYFDQDCMVNIIKDATPKLNTLIQDEKKKAVEVEIAKGVGKFLKSFFNVIGQEIKYHEENPDNVDVADEFQDGFVKGMVHISGYILPRLCDEYFEDVK